MNKSWRFSSHATLIRVNEWGAGCGGGGMRGRGGGKGDVLYMRLYNFIEQLSTIQDGISY